MKLCSRLIRYTAFLLTGKRIIDSLRVILSKNVRVQDEHFSEEKGFIQCDTERKILLPEFEPPIHELRDKLSTTELVDLLMM